MKRKAALNLRRSLNKLRQPKMAVAAGVVVFVLVAGGGLAYANWSATQRRNEAARQAAIKAAQSVNQIESPEAEVIVAPDPTPAPAPPPPVAPPPAAKPAPTPAAPAIKPPPNSMRLSASANGSLFLSVRPASPTGYIALMSTGSGGETNISGAMKVMNGTSGTITLTAAMMQPNFEHAVRVCVNNNGACGTATNTVYVTYKVNTCGPGTNNPNPDGTMSNPCALYQWAYR